jgi:hypothetical protein
MIIKLYFTYGGTVRQLTKRVCLFEDKQRKFVNRTLDIFSNSSDNSLTDGFNGIYIYLLDNHSKESYACCKTDKDNKADHFK